MSSRDLPNCFVLDPEAKKYVYLSAGFHPCYFFALIMTRVIVCPLRASSTCQGPGVRFTFTLFDLRRNSFVSFYHTYDNNIKLCYKHLEYNNGLLPLDIIVDTSFDVKGKKFNNDNCYHHNSHV